MVLFYFLQSAESVSQLSDKENAEIAPSTTTIAAESKRKEKKPSAVLPAKRSKPEANITELSNMTEPELPAVTGPILEIVPPNLTLPAVKETEADKEKKDSEPQYPLKRKRGRPSIDDIQQEKYISCLNLFW